LEESRLVDVSQPQSENELEWLDFDAELTAFINSSHSPPLPGSRCDPLCGTSPTAIAHIRELSPNWDYCQGGAKVLITGHFPVDAAGSEPLVHSLQFITIILPSVQK